LQIRASRNIFERLAGQQIQSLAAKFPTQRNREFPDAYQGKFFEEQGICILISGRSGGVAPKNAGDRKKARSNLGARSNLWAFTWANCKRRSDGASQRKGSGEKHGNTYALRQGLSNDSLSERPICT
jgi:hypothetical protein